MTRILRCTTRRPSGCHTLLAAGALGLMLAACGSLASPTVAPGEGSSAVPIVSPTLTAAEACATAVAEPTIDPAQAARAGSARATAAAMLRAATATACASLSPPVTAVPASSGTPTLTATPSATPDGP